MRFSLTLLFLGFHLFAFSQVEILLKIKQPPALDFEISGQEMTILSGNSVLLAESLVLTGGTPPYQYSWFPSTQLSNPAVLHPVATPAVSVIYNLTVTDQKGCSFALPFTVHVISLLQVSAQVADAGCKGDSNGSVKLNVSQGLPPYTYAWSNGATTSQITGLKAGIYQVTVTDSFGQTLHREFEIKDSAEIKTSVSASICSGEEYTVGQKRYGVTGAYRDTLVSKSGCDSIVHLSLTVFPTFKDTVTASVCAGETFVFRGNSYIEGGHYPHHLESVLGCDSLVTLSLTVHPLPAKPVITVVADTLTSSASLHQWYLNGEMIAGADKPKLVIGKSGNYQVHAISEHGCRIASEAVQVIYSQVGSPAQSGLRCTLFPNPNDGRFSVRMTGTFRDKVDLLIMDINGRVLSRHTVNNFRGEHTEILQLQLAPGVYTLRMITGNEVLSRQFIVN